MKRVMLALLGLLLAASLTAQNRTFRIERGTATQEMQAGGLSAAHSSIPIGSKVRVTNPANGMDIEVTIIDKIPESPRRIIDLSPGAALALDLGTGGPVMVTPTSIAQPIASDADIKVDTAPEAGTESEKSSPPYNITINNYLTNQDKPAQAAPVAPPQAEPVAQAAPPVAQAAPPVQAAPAVSATRAEDRQERPIRNNMAANPRMEPDYYRYGEEMVSEPPAWQMVQPFQPFQPPVQPAQPAAPPPLYTSPPVNNIRIMPGLPDPHSDKLYRLFVGTYQGVDNAFRVYQQLQAAGFDVAQEQAGDMCRLYATGIPAGRVYYAAQRLGAIGFEQVWIHE
jgi:rare lipoprotein A